jgi:hypothetical protein
MRIRARAELTIVPNLLGSTFDSGHGRFSVRADACGDLDSARPGEVQGCAVDPAVARAGHRAGAGADPHIHVLRAPRGVTLFSVRVLKDDRMKEVRA